MKKKRLPRWAVLVVMFVGIIYVIEEFYTRSKTSLASLPSLISVLIVCLLGIFIYFPRKEKRK